MAPLNTLGAQKPLEQVWAKQHGEGLAKLKSAMLTTGIVCSGETLADYIMRGFTGGCGSYHQLAAGACEAAAAELRVLSVVMNNFRSCQGLAPEDVAQMLDCTSERLQAAYELDMVMRATMGDQMVSEDVTVPDASKKAEVL